MNNKKQGILIGLALVLLSTLGQVYVRRDKSVEVLSFNSLIRVFVLPKMAHLSNPVLGH